MTEIWRGGEIGRWRDREIEIRRERERETESGRENCCGSSMAASEESAWQRDR